MSTTPVPEEQYKEVQVNFQQTVQPSSGSRVTRSFNYAGKITHVMFHFPPGTNGLVDVRLFKNEYPFYPLEGWLALDDSTPIYYMNVDYYAKEPLSVEIQNRDGINPHNVTVAVTIRYKRQQWDET